MEVRFLPPESVALPSTKVWVVKHARASFPIAKRPKLQLALEFCTCGRFLPPESMDRGVWIIWFALVRFRQPHRRLFIAFSTVAKLVERLAVNRRYAGSSPARGACLQPRRIVGNALG